MKLNKLAFSLIELLVVVGIIAIVGMASVSNFGNFSDRQNFQNISSSFLSIISNLDKEVIKNNISDYEISLTSGNLYYNIYTNGQNSLYKRVLTLDNSSLSGSLKLASMTSTGYYWEINLLSDYSANETESIDATETYNYKFASGSSFKISSSLSGTSIADLELRYFSQKNRDVNLKKVDKTYLTAINTKSDKTGTNLSQVSLENINNKKFIKNQSGQIIDKVFLFFETEGKEFNLEIK